MTTVRHNPRPSEVHFQPLHAFMHSIHHNRDWRLEAAASCKRGARTGGGFHWLSACRSQLTEELGTATPASDARGARSPEQAGRMLTVRLWQSCKQRMHSSKVACVMGPGAASSRQCHVKCMAECRCKRQAEWVAGGDEWNRSVLLLCSVSIVLCIKEA